MLAQRLGKIWPWMVRLLILSNLSLLILVWRMHGSSRFRGRRARFFAELGRQWMSGQLPKFYVLLAFANPESEVLPTLQDSLAAFMSVHEHPYVIPAIVHLRDQNSDGTLIRSTVNERHPVNVALTPGLAQELRIPPVGVYLLRSDGGILSNYPGLRSLRLVKLWVADLLLQDEILRKLAKQRELIEPGSIRRAYIRRVFEGLVGKADLAKVCRVYVFLPRFSCHGCPKRSLDLLSSLSESLNARVEWFLVLPHQVYAQVSAQQPSCIDTSRIRLLDGPAFFWEGLYTGANAKGQPAFVRASSAFLFACCRGSPGGRFWVFGHRMTDEERNQLRCSLESYLLESSERATGEPREVRQ